MYKIKRFLKRNFKKILRLIIIFGLFSVFSVSAFAQTYDNFSYFMAGSTAYGYRYAQDGYISGQEMIEDMGDYDNIYIRSPGAGYGGILDPYWFGGMELIYENGVNYSVSYTKGDYIYLSHQLYISTYKSYDITGDLGDFELDLTHTYIDVYAINEYGGTEVQTYSGKSFVKSITYDTWFDDLGTEYKAMLVDIVLKQPLPSYGQSIWSIHYRFPSMFSGDSIYFALSPSNSSSVIFEVGDVASMATFPDFGNNTTLKEEEALAQELRTDAQARFIQGFADIANTTGNIIGYRPFNNGIVAASSMINEFLFDVDTYEDIVVAPTIIRNLLWISLTIGLCIFILNIGVPLAVRAFGQSKKGGD